MPPTAASDMVIQFIPLMTLQLLYVAIVFVLARKRGVGPWLWSIGSLVPGLGLIVAGAFMLISFLTVFDRLNALETHAPFD